MVEIEKNWMAVSGERIVAYADTKERAEKAAKMLGVEYECIVADPEPTPRGPF
jgi:hypothetical protein